MENIAKFLEGCERLGCPKHDLFQTIDLYESKNLGQVVDAIHSLSRHAAKAGCDVPVCLFSPCLGLVLCSTYRAISYMIINPLLPKRHN